MGGMVAAAAGPVLICSLLMLCVGEGAGGGCAGAATEVPAVGAAFFWRAKPVSMLRLGAAAAAGPSVAWHNVISKYMIAF